MPLPYPLPLGGWGGVEGASFLPRVDLARKEADAACSKKVQCCRHIIEPELSVLSSVLRSL